METMRVEVIGKEIIKPFTTTPNDLRNFQLSLVDQSIPPIYTVALLFYTKHDLISREHSSLNLKKSLSETLTRFYPFAGRINGLSIDCNDEGAVFVDAFADSCPLSDFLRSPDFETLQQLLPIDAEASPTTWPLLLVKATYFQCGGMSIGICISHMLADASSLSTFIQAWAATARGESDSVTSPVFAATKIFPPANDQAIKFPVADVAVKKTSVTKRFVFAASKLEKLRVKATSVDSVPRPTRIQSVTSLIWKCATAVSPHKTKEKVLIHPHNLRPKVPSLLSENIIGNLVFSTLTLKEKGEVEIVETVMELQKRKEELDRLVQHDEDGSSMTIGLKLIGQMNDNYSKFSPEAHNWHGVTSWCKFPLYNVCFGWGSPVWVVGNIVPVSEYLTVLMDSNDGEGIEAWVTLPQENMSLFEQNPELLAFASVNPSVLILSP